MNLRAVGPVEVPEGVKALYGYTVPGTARPHIVACTTNDSTAYTLLESASTADVIELLDVLGDFFGVQPTVLPSLGMYLRR